MWIRVFPDKPFSKKPAETRMGKGKGVARGLGRGDAARDASCSRWKAWIRATAREALRLAAHKLPVKNRSVVEREVESRWSLTNCGR